MVGEDVYCDWWENTKYKEIYKHKKIRCICLVWHFERMEPAKVLSAAVDEPDIIFFKSFCLIIQESFAIPSKNWLFLNKTLNIFFLIPVITWIYALFMVTLLKLLIWTPQTSAMAPPWLVRLICFIGFHQVVFL